MNTPFKCKIVSSFPPIRKFFVGDIQIFDTIYKNGKSDFDLRKETGNFYR